MKTTDIIFIAVTLIGLIFAIVAAGTALERRKARKLASSLLGWPCPFCDSPLGKDAIRSARLEFEDDDISLVCSACTKTVIQCEKDRIT